VRPEWLVWRPEPPYLEGTDEVHCQCTRHWGLCRV
jgi:hypothetical protein